jgi:hypothetical protein
MTALRAYELIARATGVIAALGRIIHHCHQAGAVSVN